MTGTVSKKKWVANKFDGSWVRGATAGGCRNFLDSFACNPQFQISLEETDENEQCTCIIALMQKHRRKLRQQGVGELLTIGFAIYKVK